MLKTPSLLLKSNSLIKMNDTPQIPTMLTCTHKSCVKHWIIPVLHKLRIDWGNTHLTGLCGWCNLSTIIRYCIDFLCMWVCALWLSMFRLGCSSAHVEGSSYLRKCKTLKIFKNFLQKPLAKGIEVSFLNHSTIKLVKFQN